MKAQAFNDAQRDSFAEAERMAVRLALADRVLISTPMWNFSIPYKLKQWFDIIVQPGLTFRFDPVPGICPAAEGPADHRHHRQWQRFRHRNEPRAHRHGNALPARNFAFCRYQQCPFRSDRTNHRTATAHRGWPAKEPINVWPQWPRASEHEALALRDPEQARIRRRESRQIVPQKNIDADALLVGADRLTRTMREQHSRRRPRLVTGILVDDGVERAADQETPRVLGQLMRDPDHLARASRGLERVGDAAVPGAAAVDAAQIGRGARAAPP